MKKTNYAACDANGNVLRVIVNKNRKEAKSELSELNIDWYELLSESRWAIWQNEEASLLLQEEIMGCWVCGTKVGPFARQDSNLAYCGCQHSE
jgi:hypothetical protein